jgi:hypothetical protein
MIKWELLEPRNLAVIAGFSIAAILIYNHFAARLGQKG